MKQIKITVKDETYDEISRLAEKRNIASSVMAKLLLIDGLGQRRLWAAVEERNAEIEKVVTRVAKER
jgi:adenylate cyclase